MSAPIDASNDVTARRANSGRWIVLGMFTFGVLATTGLWVYWKLHLGPFFPLQKALADTFPDSLPRVEGGRHRKAPPVLRVVLKIPFAPRAADARVADISDRVLSLARQHADLDQYETLEIYLVFPRPEQAADRLKAEYRRDGETWTRTEGQETRG